MKKLYSLICAGLFFSLAASAQFTKTYATISAGLWSNPDPMAPPIWDPRGMPPPDCENCLIQLNAPGIVQLNTQLVLNSNSTLQIADGVTLQVVPSGGTSFNIVGTTPGNYIVLTNNGNNNISLLGGTSEIDASNTGLSNFDGIFTSFPTDNTGTNFTLVKAVGSNSGNLTFLNNAPQTIGAAQHGTTLIGTQTLNGFGALPILLSSFTAALDENVVDLAWTTSLEVNADHIGIQRSTDAGAHWNTIGTEAAKGSLGTSTNYTYRDTKPAAGTSEYRLQLVDKDGKYTYSEVKTIRTSLVTAVSVYPNPARDYVNVTLGGTSTETISVRLFNQSGQLLQEKNVSNGGGTIVPLAVSSYPQGNYVIVVTGADGAKQTSKLMITK